MQRGKRKSPLVGGSQPLDNSILYSRYTDLSAVLMDGEQAPASAVTADGTPSSKKEKREKKEKKAKRKAREAEAGQEADGALNGTAVPASEAGDHPAAAQNQRKKPRWTDEQKAAARAEREASKAAKKANKQQPAPAAPSPAEGGDMLPAAATPAAGDGEDGQKSSKKKKKKGVDGPVLLSPEERVSGPGNAEEAQRMRQALGAKEEAEGSSSEESSEESSEDEESSSSSEDEESSSEEESDEDEQQEEGRAAPKQAAASSSESDSSSDDSSSSEDEGEGAGGAAKQAASSGDDSSSDSSSSDSDDEGAAQQAGEFVPRRVYVGGMPYGYSEDQIWEYWGYCGEIESLDMMTFPDTGRFRGIAFITFKTEEAYQAALACNGEQCNGQTLKVMKCRPSAKDRQRAQEAAPAQRAAPQAFAPPTRYDEPPAEQAAPQHAQQEQPGRQPRRQQQQDVGAAPAPSKRQHAGPAPKTPGYHVAYVGNVAYEADDKALARLFEPYGVTKVRLHTDKDTGKPKGFAHIHFREEEGLDQAQALDGTNLLGRRIRVGYAQPKRGDGAGQ